MLFRSAVFPAAYGAYAEKRAAVEKVEAPAISKPEVPVVRDAPPTLMSGEVLPANSHPPSPTLLLVVIGMSAVAFTTLIARRYEVI